MEDTVEKAQSGEREKAVVALLHGPHGADKREGKPALLFDDPGGNSRGTTDRAFVGADGEGMMKALRGGCHRPGEKQEQGERDDIGLLLSVHRGPFAHPVLGTGDDDPVGELHAEVRTRG